MVRYKTLDRVARNVSIDRDLDDKIRKDYPGKGNDLINEALREKLKQRQEEGKQLIGFNSKAGQLAYIQAMEKLGLHGETDYKLLDDENMRKFSTEYMSALNRLKRVNL